MAAKENVLAGLSAVFLAGSAHAQKTYECKDPVTGSIYQRYEPCPPGGDARATPEQQRTDRKSVV